MIEPSENMPWYKGWNKEMKVRISYSHSKKKCSNTALNEYYRKASSPARLCSKLLMPSSHQPVHPTSHSVSHSKMFTRSVVSEQSQLAVLKLVLSSQVCTSLFIGIFPRTPLLSVLTNVLRYGCYFRSIPTLH